MLINYREFVEAFERLSPYELDHFSKLFFDHFVRLLPPPENTMCTIKRDDLRDVITHAMQAAHLEIAQKKIESAKSDYDMVRARILSPKDAQS